MLCEVKSLSIDPYMRYGTGVTPEGGGGGGGGEGGYNALQYYVLEFCYNVLIFTFQCSNSRVQ